MKERMHGVRRAGAIVAGDRIAWVAALSLATWACQAVVAQSRARGTAAPDLTIGATQYPDDDAIILRWEQHWTIEKDGTVRRRDHKWLKLLNARPIRAVADPRVDVRLGQDELTIHTAQTILPNGKVVPVPDYSYNRVSPNDVAGWPEYANWEQTVVSFSGIETGCVLELDYEVVTQPGSVPWIEADLRLDDDYPTVERIVAVTAPDGVVLNHRLDGFSPDTNTFRQRTEGGSTTYRWAFKNLAGARAEPQSPPWQERCARLRFTTCPGIEVWVSSIQKCVADAAKPDDAIRRFAESAVEGEPDPAERAGKIAKKLRDTFNFVTSYKTHRSLQCRSASEVLRSNYGSPLESAALLIAALRALGMDVSTQVAVHADTWSPEVPTFSMLAGVVAVANLPDGPARVHPRHGVLADPASWGRKVVLSVDERGGAGRSAKLHRWPIHARGQVEPSEMRVTGKLAVDGDGKLTGELRIRLTGAFYDPSKLQTSAQQEAFIKRTVGRLVSDSKVTGHSITMLSDKTLKATAQVASKGPLKRYGKQNLLQLGNGPAFLADFPLPLGRSHRTTDVRLRGRFSEGVDLTVELPKDWVAAIVPAALPPVEGNWGTAEQVLEVSGRQVRLHRAIATTSDTIAADDFASLREAVNDLKAAGSRTLLVGPGEG